MFEDHEFCSETNLGHVRVVVAVVLVQFASIPPLYGRMREFRNRVIYSLVQSGLPNEC